MSSKKRFMISIAAAFVVGITAAVLCHLLGVGDKLALVKRLRELKEDTYVYTVQVHAEGLGSKLLGDALDVTIEGKKSGDHLRGMIRRNGSDWVEVYADITGEAVFNIAPAIPSSFLTALLPDQINVTLDQIEQLTDAKLRPDVRNQMEGLDLRTMLLGMREYRDIPAEKKLLGEDAVYYMAARSDGEDRYIIGIPKNREDRRISLEVPYNGGIWQFAMEYEPAESEQIELPEATLSEETIEMLRGIIRTVGKDRS